MQTEKQVSTIFAAVAAHPALFQSKPELRHKVALDIVLTQFKDKNFNLGRLRSLAQALGRECMAAILESVASPVSVSLVAKIDKANKAQASEGNFATTHLLALAFAEIEPQPPTAKLAKAAKAPKVPKYTGSDQPVVRTLHLSKALARKG